MTNKTRETVKRKIRRLNNGEPPRVLDLFAGCGGLSLGFQAAGFKIVGAVENDPAASRTHARNFHKESHCQAHAQPKNITEFEPADLRTMLQLGRTVGSAVDVIIGGPPCQAFARIGRAKLREIAEHPDAFLQDARANLYVRYLDYVREFKPLALVMENVPDALNFGGTNVAEETAQALESLGYVTKYSILNAAFFGVPQMRERVILIAYRKELQRPVSFPEPVLWADLPVGYHNSRNVALRSLTDSKQMTLPFEDLRDQQHYVPFQEPDENSPAAITCRMAMDDLPAIGSHLAGNSVKQPQRFKEIKAYPSGKQLNAYTQLMRNWPGYENQEGFIDHEIRYTPRDYQLFRRMKPGDQYPQAHELALRMCEEERIRRKIKIGTKQHDELIAEIVPPYDPSKFPNKWRKLESFLPSRTLLAHLGKDTYTHIHYDRKQARMISVREAARLQSFPDGFEFHKTLNGAFRQIGNAVPPLLAYAIASSVQRVLGAQPDAASSRFKKLYKNVCSKPSSSQRRRSAS
jgi:DNA (cytosine-5)-methyltransferase 1